MLHGKVRRVTVAKVKWDSISKYLEQAHVNFGQIERADVLELADKAGANDDVVDALDAIGSRVFRSVADAKKFLLTTSYVIE